jgi:hypothetical protein
VEWLVQAQPDVVFDCMPDAGTPPRQWPTFVTPNMSVRRGMS